MSLSMAHIIFANIVSFFKLVPNAVNGRSAELIINSSLQHYNLQANNGMNCNDTTTVFIIYLSYQLHCCTLPDKRCLSHGMLPLSGHDDVALFE